MRIRKAASGCPLTVVGGFLGAGKTTFLNHLLAGARGRTAVLVNDFGAVNVDAGLIADHDGTTMRLTNGCVCCSLADGFLDTLMRVLAEPFDHVVIEASGVGDPWAIAEIALVEPTLRLDAVIVLADAARLPALLADARVGDTVRRQLVAADLVVLNKVDLVDRTGRAAAHAALATAKPGTRVVEAVDARVPADLLNTVDPGPRSRFHAASQPSHEAIFRRVLYRRNAAFDADRLGVALDALPPSLLRLKGSLRMVDRAEPLLLQMVGSRWEVSLLATASTSSWSVELVGIGTDALPENDVERILDAAIV